MKEYLNNFVACMAYLVIWLMGLGIALYVITMAVNIMVLMLPIIVVGVFGVFIWRLRRK